MSKIDMTMDTFTCHQVDDLAVITILEGANILSSTVSGKENLKAVLNTIRDTPDIKGLAVLYSDKYPGNTEYRRFLQENIEAKHYKDKSNYAVTYKSALIQFLEMINTYPIPIVGGMSGEIGPDSFGINLAFDLRIAAKGTSFFHPNLQFGLPPSPPLAFYLLRSLGYHRATELILTKPKLSSQEALDLGLIAQVVSTDDLENTCLEKLRHLSPIPDYALVESRRMLQPDIEEIRKYIEAGFEGALRCLYKMKT